MFYGNGNRKPHCAARTKFFLFPRVYGNGNVGKQTPEGLNTNEHGGVSITKFHRDSSPTNMFFFVWFT